MKHSGHTLVELVLCVGILGVLMLAMASTVALASRAIPSTSEEAVRLEMADETLRRLADEARYAIEFPTLTGGESRRLLFTLADRDGDGNPERVEYAWSGVAGEPLTRSYNGGEPVAVVPGVRAFGVTPSTRVVRETYVGPTYRESFDRVVHGYQYPAIRTAMTLSKDYWAGQAFQLPATAIPERAVGWEPTEVSLRAAATGIPTDILDIAVHRASDNGLPVGGALARGQLLETLLLLGQFSFQPVPMSGSQVLAVDQPYALVTQVQGLIPGLAGVRVEREGSTGAGASNLLTSPGRTNSWSVANNLALIHEIKGRFWVRRPDQSVDRTYVTGAEVRLAFGDADTPARTTRIVAANTPEVLKAAWRLDFGTNPSQLDSNGDGQPDWAVRSGLTLGLTDLLGGLLRWEGTLESRPKHDFVDPTTIEARLRSTSSVDTELRIHADASGGRAAPIYFRLGRRGNGSQTLELFNETGVLSAKRLAVVEDLPDDFIRVRLLIDPRHDTVNLAVDGEYVGTYAYERYGLLLADDRFVSLVSNSGSRWDWVDVRVGGVSP